MFLNKTGRVFANWITEMEKPGTEPDGLTLVFMSHFLGRNITLLSGKADEWKVVEDTGDDIILIYKGDNQYSPTNVGTYLSIFCLYIYIYIFLFSNIFLTNSQ